MLLNPRFRLVAARTPRICFHSSSFCYASSPSFSAHGGVLSSPTAKAAAGVIACGSDIATSTNTARHFSYEPTAHHHDDGIFDSVSRTRKEEEEEEGRDELNPMPNFDDTEAAYRSKSTGELVRAAVSFSLCRVPWLVNGAETALYMSRKILGDTITDLVLKNTLYGHFCAGEDGERIQGKVQALEENGIGSILDYAAEDDDDDHVVVVQDKKKNAENEIFSSCDLVAEGTRTPVGRVYDYKSESECDRNLEVFHKCIQDVARLRSDGFAAIKVTALCNPKLLERTSKAITEAQNLFSKFDTNGDGLISRDEFERAFALYFRDDAAKVKDMMTVEHASFPNGGSATSSSDIDYIAWSMMLSPRDLPKVTSGCRDIGPLSLAAPTEEEVRLIERMYERGHALAREAASCGVRLLIDAEHYRYQPAIDTLVLDLQRTYNATTESDYPIIYNTYQCYLKDSLDRLRTDVERSERFGYHFGTKLVRGAYMESERKLAEQLCYPSPIHDAIEDTHNSYDSAVEFLLRHAQRSDKQVELLLATHNQESVVKAVQVMNELGVPRTNPTVSFAQLYGMKDNLTYNLGKHGYRAYKYVPYGEVKMVIPYLVRRANENSAVAGGAKIELSLAIKELSRRLKLSSSSSS